MATTRGVSMIFLVAMVVVASNCFMINVVFATEQGTVTKFTPLFEAPSTSSRQKAVLDSSMLLSVVCQKTGMPGKFSWWFYVIIQATGMNGYVPAEFLRCGVSGCQVPNCSF